MTDFSWDVGTYFKDKEAFKDVIRTYVIHFGRNMKLVKNDNSRVRVCCIGAQGQCEWCAYCEFLPSTSCWQLRKLNDVHTCVRSFKVNLLRTKWLSGRLETSLCQNPRLRSNDVRNKAVKKWNISISNSKAQREMAMTLKNVCGSFQDKYKRNYDYAHELMRANPGSTMKVKVEDINGFVVFNIFYVCLKACKDRFISCRPIIALDGCFLKGFYGGELLTTVGRDPNDQMLPLAYVVVEVECKESWSWFL